MRNGWFMQVGWGRKAAGERRHEPDFGAALEGWRLSGVCVVGLLGRVQLIRYALGKLTCIIKGVCSPRVKPSEGGCASEYHHILRPFAFSDL